MPSLPCPHCGACTLVNVKEPGAAGRFYVECTACGATGPAASTYDAAWSAWNTREPLPGDVPLPIPPSGDTPNS